MIRTRIAPSPTGQDIHIGNLYTAYINNAIARKNKGQFIIRVEDTDRERRVEGSEERILKTIRAYGIKYDEGPDIGGPYAPYRQSERLSIYKKYAEELIEKGAAYYCFCSKERLDEIRKKQIKEKKVAKYDRYCFEHETCNIQHITYKGNKPYVIRLKIPENREIKFNDVIRGEIKFQSENLDDQVLIKSDGFPTYHLAVVVDDYLMKISHVIRAEEWISSTPKHILLYEAFGWDLPVFAHLPLLRNADRSKLSKRKNPVWASWYLAQGFFPEAVLNYLALMGWSYPDQREKFTTEEFIENLRLEDIKPVGPAFDLVKLEWLNGVYIRDMKDEDLKKKIVEYIGDQYEPYVVDKTIPIIKERIKKLADYLPLCGFFFKRPESHEVDLTDKKLAKGQSSYGRDLFKQIYEELAKIEDWQREKIGETMQSLVKKIGMKTGEFFMLLRVAITGKKISPPLNESMEILGKNECLERVKLSQV